MTNNKHIDTMHNSYNNRSNNKSSTNNTSNGDTITRMHPSMKRPRAPIACYRCHHKKVRCDGVHPNCTRCLSTGVLCAYPSSRRSRNTQPTNVDPFIDNLSQLEARIRRIETDLESQRTLVRTVCATDSPTSTTTTNNTLTSRIIKTEKDLQESRSIVAQLRLRGEQRAARGRRAAAAAAASVTTTSSTPGPEKNNSLSGKSVTNTAKRNKSKSNNKKDTIKSPYNNPLNNNNNNNDYNPSTSPPFYFNHHHHQSSIDFINPSPSYYFPNYNTDISPICTTNNNNNNNSSSSAQFNMMVNDWPLLNDLPHTTTVHNNGFVDPMIIATAEAHQHGIAPPLLSVSTFVDEDNSIMAARAKSLSHLPPQHHMMSIPGLQPSSSSTSTCSNNSTNYNNYNVYDTSYTNFMDSNTNDTIIMMDQQQNI